MNSKNVVQNGSPVDLQTGKLKFRSAFLFFMLFYLLFGTISAQRPAMTGDPGFFLEDWKPKRFSGINKFTEVTQPESNTVTVNLDFGKVVTKVSPYLFGNNANTWMGRECLGNEEFIMHLKDIDVPVIRYPGGNLANDFFWDAATPGEFPEGVPDSICRNFFKGKVGTPHPGNIGSYKLNPEGFYEMANRVGATGSICVNYSYALYGEEKDPDLRLRLAGRYAAGWVYDANIINRAGIKFWEIGNENWGQWQAGYYVWDRGYINPKVYGEHFRTFVDSMKAVDPDIKIGVVAYQKKKGSDPEGIMARWNEEVLPEVMDHADFIILHSYFVRHGKAASPETMLNSVDTAYSFIKVVNDAIEKYTDKKANHLPIALTEFNTASSASISKQDGASNVSHTAGVFFAHALGELTRQGFGMAMMWDFVNGYADGKDHGMFSSGKETDMPTLSPHPSFYHYYFYNKCFGDKLFSSNTDKSSIRVYPTTFSSGEIGLVVINKSSKEEIVKIDLKEKEHGGRLFYYEFFNEDPLSRKTFINGNSSSLPAGGPSNYRKIKPFSTTFEDDSFNLTSRPFSVNYVIIDKPQ